VEAIYERTEVYHAVGARVARRLRLPLVVEVNGPLVDERICWGGLLFPEYARRLEIAKYAAADGVVTVSDALGKHLSAEGVDPAKIHVIPNGVDTRLFHPQRAYPDAVRQKFGLGRRLVIGFVGAFADWHGLTTLVAAMGEIARGRTPDVHLLMVGDGPSRPALRELAREAGLDGRISLPGSVPHDQVPHYIAAMDLCVLPRANWYMSPIKLFEYIGAKIPSFVPDLTLLSRRRGGFANGLQTSPCSYRRKPPRSYPSSALRSVASSFRAAASCMSGRTCE
jgi:glycosyltransferase involved in cell wall biosynthesis